MDEQSESTFRTSSRLMADLHNGSAAAWDEFVAKYTRLIHYQCRRHRLPETDIDDLTQEVLIRLFASFRTFEYDRDKGKFRGFLRKTTEFAIDDFWRRQTRRPVAVGGEDGSGGLPDPASKERFIDELVQTLLLADVESVVLDGAPAWQQEAYLLSQQGKTDEEIAELLQQKPGTVSVSLWRIARRIEDEMRKRNEP